MIINNQDYLEFIGVEPPTPLIKYYTRALNQLKQYCPKLDIDNIEYQEEIKQAIMFQMEHLTNYDNIDNFSIGKFSMNNEKGNLYNNDAIIILNKLPFCSLWLNKEYLTCQ